MKNEIKIPLWMDNINKEKYQECMKHTKEEVIDQLLYELKMKDEKTKKIGMVLFIAFLIILILTINVM